MSNKFYIVTKGFYVDEVEILKASSDRNKLERYIEAVRKRNPDDVDELDIVEVDEYDDSYIKIMPENPIYQFHYNKKTNRFNSTKPLKLSFDEETYFIAKNGECKCIPKDPIFILVYVRAKDEKEAFQKAQKSIDEYLNKNYKKIDICLYCNFPMGPTFDDLKEYFDKNGYDKFTFHESITEGIPVCMFSDKIFENPCLVDPDTVCGIIENPLLENIELSKDKKTISFKLMDNVFGRTVSDLLENDETSIRAYPRIAFSKDSDDNIKIEKIISFDIRCDK